MKLSPITYGDWMEYGKSAIAMLPPALHQKFIDWAGARTINTRIYERDYRAAVRVFLKAFFAGRV